MPCPHFARNFLNGYLRYFIATGSNSWPRSLSCQNSPSLPGLMNVAALERCQSASTAGAKPAGSLPVRDGPSCSRVASRRRRSVSAAHPHGLERLRPALVGGRCPRGTVSEVSSWRLLYRQHRGQDASQIVPPHSCDPMRGGLTADPEEKRGPARDINDRCDGKSYR
jgi:hypothetical protein